DSHRVHGDGPRLALAMAYRAVGDVGQVLVERPAARDVEQLCASTYAEHRHTQLLGVSADRELELVHSRVDRSEVRASRGAVERRVDVRASAYEQPGELLEQCPDTVEREHRNRDR